MLTLRGQRLLNNLLAGSFTGITLESELADSGAKFALREMLDGSPRHARLALANTTARTALLGSATARGILVDCRAALSVVAKERDILLALAADANTRTAINASTVALRAIASDNAGAVTWMAQLLNVAGLHTQDPEALFLATNAAYAASAPALFLMAVNPIFAAPLVRSGKAAGLNATIDATLTAAGTLFAKQAGVSQAPSLGSPGTVRWGDEAILLVAFYVTATGSHGGGAYPYSPAPKSRADKLFTIDLSLGQQAAVGMVAPKGFWFELIPGQIVSSFTFTTYIAK